MKRRWPRPHLVNAGEAANSSTRDETVPGPIGLEEGGKDLADGGFDLVIDKPSTPSTLPSVYFRANVAGGYRVQKMDLTLELVNIAAVNGASVSGIDKRFFHTLAVGVRTRGTNQIHFGTVFPLDEGTRGNNWIVSLGYQRVVD